MLLNATRRLANLLIKIGADISELITQTNNARRKFESFSESVSRTGKIVAGAFGAHEIVSFGQELLKMGDDIVRTADRTGTVGGTGRSSD